MRHSPIIYIPHGGGPLPLLGDDDHREMTDFLRSIVTGLPKPEAILIVSAHWEEPVPTVTGAGQPNLIYDYYGFPDAAYKIKYPAPGSTELAQEVLRHIHTAGLSGTSDSERGFDHGMFVPLKIMYPDADIPCVQLSLIRGLNPLDHIQLGKALRNLRERNILVVGSGMSYHNLREFFGGGPDAEQMNGEFHKWLIDTWKGEGGSVMETTRRLIDWEKAPHARNCHPREEHLLPLHVCYGMAAEDTPRAEEVFSGSIMGRRVTALLWR